MRRTRFGALNCRPRRTGSRTCNGGKDERRTRASDDEDDDYWMRQNRAWEKRSPEKEGRDPRKATADKPGRASRGSFSAGRPAELAGFVSPSGPSPCFLIGTRSAPVDQLSIPSCNPRSCNALSLRPRGTGKRRSEGQSHGGDRHVTGTCTGSKCRCPSSNRPCCRWAMWDSPLVASHGLDKREHLHLGLAPGVADQDCGTEGSLCDP